jgi:hypothetical protein
MKDMFAVIAAIGLTVFCWGIYGPTLHKGQANMGQSRFRPFICVGLAYFAIAVVVPIIILNSRGESGSWTATGTIWSLAAGTAGALGALGIILAFNYAGPGGPTYVMPLVFGCAPIVNSFFAMYLTGAWREFNPMRLGGFMAGLILVSVGAAMILILAPKPKGHGPAHPPTAAPTAPATVEAQT